MDPQRHHHHRAGGYVFDAHPAASARRGHQIDAGAFATHRFGLDEFLDAYDVFSRAGDTGALKVVLSR